MANEQLDEYIKKSRQAGMSDEAIRSSLKDAGWQETDIEAGLSPSSDSNNVNLQSNGQKPNAKSLLKSKKFLLSLAGIILVLIISAGLLGYFIFYPKWVKDQVIKGIQKVEIGKIEGDMAFTGTEGEPAKVTLNGYFDGRDEKNSKADLNLGLDVPLGEGINIQAEANVRQIGDKTYIKLDKVPGGGLIDLSALKDQWIYIEPSSAGELTGSNTNVPTTVNTKGVEEALNAKDTFKEFKKVKGEKVDGKPCHKFDFEISKDKLASVIASVAGQKESDIKDSLKDIESVKGSIYSEKRNYTMRRLDITIKSKDYNVEISFKFSDIGKEQEVKEPEEYKSLEELFGGMMAPGLDGGTTLEETRP
ncbi:hypothetical protein C4544_00310 [candidate division WS5 bacterium]|uniref:Uncharacterized protein n=1 Tax=candidate division WS5 bacterium TaxID=2093353 RepID=A0A419DGS3_9BACT|nr:MAG: hypothetical protein C4544_00310 [candidate division WS5 bacterium]